MEPIRYRPGEAIRWIHTGAENSRKSAKQKGRSIINPDDDLGDIKKIGKGVSSGVGALIDLGKGAWADVLHSQAQASEYVLQDDHFDVVKPNSLKTVAYDQVKKISTKGDRTTVHLDRGVTLQIKPYAYIVAGRIKAPVGWERNGMEVPYDLLIEELSARCKVEVESD